MSTYGSATATMIAGWGDFTEKAEPWLSVVTTIADYVAADSAGLTYTSTRTVIIKAANDNHSTPANDNAPLLSATSTSS
jgi:hypothetical protein